MTHSTDTTAVSLRRRLGAIFYDYLIIIAVLLIATVFWTAAGVTEAHPLYPVYVGFVQLTVFLYFAWCWTHGGQTVGMRVWKIRLVSTRVSSFSWARAATRSVVALLSAGCFGLGYLWMFIDKKQMTWHDRMSDAYLMHTQ